MSYPLTKPPTFEEFLNKLNKNYECSITKTRIPDILKIQLNSKFITLKSRNKDDFIEWNIIHYVCENLNLPKEDFGLYLN